MPDPNQRIAIRGSLESWTQSWSGTSVSRGSWPGNDQGFGGNGFPGYVANPEGRDRMPRRDNHGRGLLMSERPTGWSITLALVLTGGCRGPEPVATIDPLAVENPVPTDV